MSINIDRFYKKRNLESGLFQRIFEVSFTSFHTSPKSFHLVN